MKPTLPSYEDLTNYEKWQLDKYSNVLPGSDKEPDEENDYEQDYLDNPLENYPID